MKSPISIVSIASISPLGILEDAIWNNYKSDQHFFSERDGNLIAELPKDAKQEIKDLRYSNSKYKQLDDTVLFGIYTARKAIEKSGWGNSNDFGINVGSSRGATNSFEKYFQSFLETQKAETLSSPITTLGNISSWIAQDLHTNGPELSHSITCSTALHAILNGVAWIQSGMCDKFLVGGSEAPLTPFTIAQMQALKIYAKTNSECPCKALDVNKSENTMILGEGAAMACIEKGISERALAVIEGIGYGTEVIKHNASLSTNADCFQRSMTMALGELNPEEIDVIVTHTPGTIKGDLAEYNAIKKVFCNKIPALTTNKIKIGHSLGASGMLSVEMGLLMLNHQLFIGIPYLEQSVPKKISKIMINAVGFGGNAVSILLSKNNSV